MTHRQSRNSVLIMVLSAMLTACASTPPHTAIPSPATGLMGYFVGSHTYYPAHLLLAGISGRALVAYSVGPNGVPERVKAIRPYTSNFIVDGVSAETR